MPRKIEPKWGQSGVVSSDDLQVPRFMVAQVRSLLTICGPAPSVAATGHSGANAERGGRSTEGLSQPSRHIVRFTRRELGEIAQQYHRQKRQDDAAPRLAERGRALELLRRNAWNLACVIESAQSMPGQPAAPQMGFAGEAADREGRPYSDYLRFRGWVEPVIMRFARIIDQSAIEPTPGERVQLISALDDFKATLFDLDDWTEGHLLDGCRVLRARGRPWDGVLTLDGRQDALVQFGYVLEWLSEAIGVTLENRQVRGRRHDRSLIIAVGEVCRLYERLSGRTATHNPYRRTEYDGAPQSEAGRFVLRAMQVIDPYDPETKRGVTPRQVSTALRRVLAGRKVKARVSEAIG